jgi:HSP20 family protein
MESAAAFPSGRDDQPGGTIMVTSLTPFGTRFPSVFSDFRREMDGLMSRFFQGEEGDGLQWYSPPINVAETDTGWEVTLDLPGMKPEDFDVEFKHGDLWITGERKYEHEEEGKTYHRVERQWGQFRRVIRMGEEVDAERVNAEYKDGVLHITVPKTEMARAKRIEVKG